MKLLFVMLGLLVLPTSANAASVQPQAKPEAGCKTISYVKWNKQVRVARQLGTKKNLRLRKTNPCHEDYKRLKKHVAKLKRANCWGRGVKCWIEKAAAKYNQPLGDAMRVAQCESNFNPGLVNPSSKASGLFQFLPSTWQTTPYRSRDIFSAKWNALAAMWMWSVGRRNEWQCK